MAKYQSEVSNLYLKYVKGEKCDKHSFMRARASPYLQNWSEINYYNALIIQTRESKWFCLWRRMSFLDEDSTPLTSPLLLLARSRIDVKSSPSDVVHVRLEYKRNIC